MYYVIACEYLSVQLSFFPVFFRYSYSQEVHECTQTHIHSHHHHQMKVNDPTEKLNEKSCKCTWREVDEWFWDFGRTK